MYTGRDGQGPTDYFTQAGSNVHIRTKWEAGWVPYQFGMVIEAIELLWTTEHMCKGSPKRGVRSG